MVRVEGLEPPRLSAFRLKRNVSANSTIPAKEFIIKRKYRNYTDQDIIDKSKEVESLFGLLRALNLKPVGGNFINMKRNLQRLKVNTDHWKGQGWSLDKQLKDYSEYTRASNIKPHLVRERGNKCQKCKLTHWLNEPIVLEIHHLDGDRTNNSGENLELLCPNCHSITDNWRGRKQN